MGRLRTRVRVLFVSFASLLVASLAFLAWILYARSQTPPPIGPGEGEIDWEMYVGIAGSVTGVVSLVATITFDRRREKRERKRFELELERQRVDLEKAKLELHRIKSNGNTEPPIDSS